MKGVLFTLIAASLIFSFVSQQVLNSSYTAEDGFTILEKPNVGGN
ncbi:hypothetical protein [Halalkalibacterium halodurans]|nr:hypothetical protein [Halalkalibacterium halodurans]MDY7224208.1 hypothetical protein [Halalkalibacterium halodurans]MDY7243493.1 hypothetical protein [Halalkalibacterium halodurans]